MENAANDEYINGINFQTAEPLIIEEEEEEIFIPMDHEIMEPTYDSLIILGSSAIVQTLWHVLIFFLDDYYIRSGINFHTYRESGYSIAFLISWTFQGLQAILWPLSYLTYNLAWAYYAVCLVNIYISMTAVWVVPVLWEGARQNGEVLFALNSFAWESILEIIIYIANLVLNLT